MPAEVLRLYSGATASTSSGRPCSTFPDEVPEFTNGGRGMGRAMTQRPGTSPAGRSTSVRDPEAADAAQVALTGLWQEYKLSASPLARDKLILQYPPLVKYVRRRLSTGLPPNIQQADLGPYAT